MYIIILLILFLINISSLVIACLAYTKKIYPPTLPTEYPPSLRNTAINYIKQKSTIVKVGYVDTNIIGDTINTVSSYIPVYYTLNLANPDSGVFSFFSTLFSEINLYHTLKYCNEEDIFN